MRIIVFFLIALISLSTQAQAVSFDAPEYAKHYCARQGDVQDLVVPTVIMMIKKAHTTQIILNVLDAECKGHKVVAKAANRFGKPSLTDLSDVHAIAASPRIFRSDEFSYHVILEFYSEAMAAGERTFILKLYTHDGGVYQIIVTTRSGATFLQAY